MEDEYSGETTILNKYGFHVRPSTQFMQLAREFEDTEITVEVDSLRADGKSIMQLMALGAMQNSLVRISARGDKKQEAVTALIHLIEGRFGGID
jgi:phosphotransferase system HPr (HPr) family protein